MSRKQRPEPWQMVLVTAIGGAAIAFVIVVVSGVLVDGAGTGVPLDFYRAIWRELTDPATWRVVGLSAVVVAAVTAVVLLFTRRGRGG